MQLALYMEQHTYKNEVVVFYMDDTLDATLIGSGLL